MSVLYVVEIEGIPARYWYGGLPSYATSDDVQGLAEPPTGAASLWRPEVPSASTPTRRLQFRDEDARGNAVGPIRWYRASPIATDELAAAAVVEASGTYQGQLTNSEAGRAVNDYLWIGTELLKLTALNPSSTFFNADRAQWGTTAIAHDVGADIYDSPPAWFGRAVELREVNAAAASSASEVTVWSGWVTGSPAAGIHSVTLPARGSLDWQLGAPKEHVVPVIVSSVLGVQSIRVFGTATDGTTPKSAHANGGYWWIDHLETLVALYVDPSTGDYYGRPDQLQRPIFAGNLEADREHGVTATQVLYSDADEEYCPFGWYESATGDTVDDHPRTIVLNLALSTETGGNDGGRARSYDRQDGTATGLYQWSIGLDADRIDWDAWDAFALRTPGVRAQRLYIGMPGKRASWERIVKSLLTPLGWSAVWLADGRLSVARLGDVYPEVTLVNLRHFVRPDSWEHSSVERPTDELVIGLDPDPAGDARHHATVKETELINLYTQIVGSQLELDATPYTLDQWVPESAPCVGVATEWMARVARGVATVKLTVDSEHWGDADVGTPVDLEDIAIRNPATGLRWATGDAPLKGYVIGSLPNATRRTTELTIAITDRGLNVSRYTAAAKITGSPTVGGSTVTYEVEDHRFTPSDSVESDADKFNVGDWVRAYDSAWRPVAGGTARELIDVATPDIEIDGTDTLGASAMFIVPAFYDEVVAAQTSRQAYTADEDFGLGAGADTPYVWGD